MAPGTVKRTILNRLPITEKSDPYYSYLLITRISKSKQFFYSEEYPELIHEGVLA